MATQFFDKLKLVTQALEIKAKVDYRWILKILVSVVRFRPGPPNSNNALLGAGHFLLVWPFEGNYLVTKIVI